jgi:hypothetical protein
MEYHGKMEPSLIITHIDALIAKQNKQYGKTLGRLIGSTIGDTQTLAELTEISTTYNSLVKLRKLQEAKEAQEEALLNPPLPPERIDDLEADEENGLPEGICASEDCEDEFCVAYWEEVENNQLDHP